MYADRVAQYNTVENGLCFVLLDFQDGSHRHIGRVGLFEDEAGDYEPLLLDNADVVRVLDGGKSVRRAGLG